jgi:hypothetical protein
LSLWIRYRTRRAIAGLARADAERDVARHVDAADQLAGWPCREVIVDDADGIGGTDVAAWEIRHDWNAVMEPERRPPPHHGRLVEGFGRVGDQIAIGELTDVCSARCADRGEHDARPKAADGPSR